MNRKIINETQFRGIVEECVRRVSQAMKPLNEAVSGGWEVDESEVQEAYNLPSYGRRSHGFSNCTLHG